ncbi:MAG: hypothetical protein GY794_21430 [bacterium]|nr:hypothetical protein [bacterium]
MLVSTAMCEEPTTKPQLGTCPKLKTVLGIPIFDRLADEHLQLRPLTKFGKIDSDNYMFTVVLYGPQMRIGKKTVLIEEVRYFFEGGRVSRATMFVQTEQGESATHVGKQKANTVDDIRAVADFIQRSGLVRDKDDPDSDSFQVVIPGWQAPVTCRLMGGKFLVVSCKAESIRSATGDKPAKKKVDLTIGGIPFGVGATLDDVVRAGFTLLKDSTDLKVTLTGPQVIFGKKKLKISRLEYTFFERDRNVPRMLAVVEASKENSSDDLMALYEYVQGKTKSIQGRKSPGKREMWGKFGPGKGTSLRCLLTTRKDSKGNQVATRLEIAYPDDWSLDPPFDIVKKVNAVKAVVRSGNWKRVDGQWIFIRLVWIYKKRWMKVKTAVDGDLVEALNRIEGTPAKTDRQLPTTVDLLTKVLVSKRWDIRLRAVLILDKGGPEVSRSAVPVLTKALKDSDPYVRKAAAAAIKNITRKPSPKPTPRPK